MGISFREEIGWLLAKWLKVPNRRRMDQEASRILEQLGVTESYVKAPIYSSMEVEEIGRTEDGVPVFIDQRAYSSDHIIVVNRIKCHTKFKAEVESGLMKMMAIGMGKRKGAELYHKAAVQYGFAKIIVEAGREVIKKAPILCIR